MNVQDLRPGDRLWLCYQGYEDGPVTDKRLVQFAGWDDRGVNITLGGLDDYVRWGDSSRFLADISREAAVVKSPEDRLPRTIPERE